MVDAAVFGLGLLVCVIGGLVIAGSLFFAMFSDVWSFGHTLLVGFSGWGLGFVIMWIGLHLLTNA